MTTRSTAKKPAAKLSPSSSEKAAPTPLVTESAPPATITPATSGSIGFIAGPPANALIPTPPSGFEPTSGTAYRGIQPGTSELVALPLAIKNLQSFTNYASVLGSGAPPLSEIQQAFQVSNDWSAMRNASTAWDRYSRDQEGLAWTAMRALIARLNPAFNLAARTNPSITTAYAGLAALLVAKSVSSQKAAAARKKNKANVAEGKLPTHGTVGKARQRAAEKAAFAAQNAKPAAPVSGAVTGQSAPVAAVGTVAPVESAPSIESTTPVAGTPVVTRS